VPDPPIQRKRPHWQLQEAKAKFSEVFEKALADGPQIVTRRNKQKVVILSEMDYQKLTRTGKTPSLIEALLAMPKVRDFKIPHRDPEAMVPPDPPLFE
jgi:prevent-host-death family protein